MSALRRPLAPAHLALLATAALAAGCVTVHAWQRPTAEFAEGAAQAQAALGSYLAGLNAFERRLYLSQRLYDPAARLEVTRDGQPTPLQAAFPPEAIRARLDALEVVVAYGQRLSEVAGSDAGSRAGQGGAELAGSVKKAAERVQGAPARAAATAYAGPVATLVALLADLWIEGRQDAALRDTVTRGAPAFRAILDQLDQDLADLKALRMTGAHEQLAQTVVWYNANAGKLSGDLAARRALLDEVDSAQRAREALEEFDPTRVTGALRDAHEALVRLAQSPRQARDAAEATAALKAFVARVSAASQAARAVTEE